KALTATANEPLQLWDLSAGKPLKTLEGHPKGTTCIALSPGGTQALTGGNDGTVRLCDLQTGKVLQRFDTKQSVLSAVAFLPDAAVLLAGRQEHPRGRRRIVLHAAGRDQRQGDRDLGRPPRRDRAAGGRTQERPFLDRQPGQDGQVLVAGRRRGTVHAQGPRR